MSGYRNTWSRVYSHLGKFGPCNQFSSTTVFPNLYQEGARNGKRLLNIGFCGAVLFSLCGSQGTVSCASEETVHSSAHSSDLAADPALTDAHSLPAMQSINGEPRHSVVPPAIQIHPGPDGPMSVTTPASTALASPTPEGLLTVASAVATALAGPLGGLTVQMASQIMAQANGQSQVGSSGLGGEILSVLATMNTQEGASPSSGNTSASASSPAPAAYANGAAGSAPLPSQPASGNATTGGGFSAPSTRFHGPNGAGDGGGASPGSGSAGGAPPAGGDGSEVPDVCGSPKGPSTGMRFLIQLGFGGVVGYSTGYTVKVVGRFSLFAIGIGLVGFHAAKAYGYIRDDDVNRLKDMSESFGLKRLREVLDVDKDGKVGLMISITS